MLFSDRDKVFILNLHQFKQYGSRRLQTEFPAIKWNKRPTDHETATQLYFNLIHTV